MKRRTYTNKRQGLRYLIVSIGLLFATSLFAQGYTIEPAFDWVNPALVPDAIDADLQNHSNGTAYLLVDAQWLVKEQAFSRYRRFVSKALNTHGVEELSQISIDFDPVYESLTLHQLQIHRAGKVLDRIHRSQKKVIQREKDLEYQIYDGSKTLSILIEDVRPGDVVEYSYSIQGANPVFAGHFSQLLPFRWSVPAGRVQYRVLWSLPRKLHIRNHETDIRPETRSAGSYTEYLWHQDKVDELVEDSNTPGWHDPYAIVYLSDFSTWKEVIAWAKPLYQPVPAGARVNAVVDSIEKTASTPEQKLLAALRFVQEEIRYLGIEIGVRSHQPNLPETVMERRFGDCKDKSRLLASMLQRMGIEASVALVNTNSGKGLARGLPTPSAFNHAIVHVQLNGNNYWLDPTLTFQGGSLENLYQPDYELALVISDKYQDLVSMSEDVSAVHKKVVEEKFDLRGAIDVPVEHHSVTHFEGYYADQQRRLFAESNLVQAQQNFLKYLANYYPHIEATESIQIVDDKEVNRFTIIEPYQIPGMWVENEEEEYLTASFQPFLIDDHIKAVTSPRRTMPYAVTHPVHYKQTTRILVPKYSRFEKEHAEIEDKAFRFTRTVDYYNNELVIEYVYESLADHVAAADIQTHAKQIRAVQDLAIFHMQIPVPVSLEDLFSKWMSVLEEHSKAKLTPP